MSKPARKPGDGRGPDSLPADDPSIPVLTERLTLPPLDLDLDFRLPPRPTADAAAPESAASPAAPAEPPIAYDDDATRYMPRVEVPRIDLARFVEPTAFEPHYPTPDDEKTRLSLAGRRAFDPAYADDEGTRIAPSPLTEQPAADALTTPNTRDTRGDSQDTDAPAAAEQTATDEADGDEATQFDTPTDAWNGTPQDAPITGMSMRGPDSVISPNTRGGPITQSGPATIVPPGEAPEPPRVPTSLLVSNLTQPASTAPTHRRPQQDDFDVPVTQPGAMNVDALDNELRERILLDLARRLPSDVDAIVRRHLETAIDEAVRRFAAEVRIALAGSLREIVDRAVKGELDRLKTPRR